MMWTDKSPKVSEETKRWIAQRIVLLGIWVLSCLTIAAYFVFFWGREDKEVHQIIQFDDKLKQFCSNSKLPMPIYTGVESFFKFLQHPDVDHCYSWIEFGGEKIPIPSQSEKECNDEIRKSKFMCFNDEYEMTKDPCLVYSFMRDADSQFERDMHMFSCEVHTFDHDKVTLSEHVQRTEFWREHAWDIGEFPYDQKNIEGKPTMRRSLDYITAVLQHKGKVIKYLKSDLEGREWILLKQIITHAEEIDIRQIGTRVHIPLNVNKMSGADRHAYFGKLFQVFQGLTCAGYKYIMARPIFYYRGTIKVPEINSTFFHAYELNFAKVLKPPEPIISY